MNELEESFLLPQGTSVYSKLTRLTYEYFGHDAPKYIIKLIRVHLKKAPELLTVEELLGLIDWIRETVMFLESDEDIIKEYIAKLSDLMILRV